MNEIILQIKNYIRSAWRFRWLAIVSSWVVAICCWAIIFVLPNQYQSVAKVYVDTDSVLRPLLQGLAVQNNMNQRLHLMTRTLLSYDNLKKLLQQTDLGYLATTDEEREQLIDWLRKRINIQVNRRQIPGARITENFYTIEFVYSDRFMARKVVQILLDIFVESALGDTRVESDAAQVFLRQQIQEYEARLVEAENKLTDFKRKNVDTLPRDSGGIFHRLDQARGDVEEVSLQLKEARIRRDELKRQYTTTLAEENKRREELGMSAATSSPTAQRLLAMQTRLDELLLRYTEQHPDVQELMSKIEELKARSSRTEVGDAASASASVSTALEELKLAYRRSEVDLRTISLRNQEYQERIEELKKKLDTLPQVEAELTRLNRDYNINRENYQELVQRLESAKMSEQADEAGDNLKFRVVEPPKIPILPIGPKRLLYSAAALVLALGLGGAVAFLFSQIMPVYFDTRTLSVDLEFPVLGQVTRVMTDEVTMKRRLAVSGFISAVFLLFLIFIVIVIVYTMGFREDIIMLIKQSGILNLFSTGS
ncbi:MAG: chain length-determining protein [Candidatus Thiodiazotropha sp. (ex Dulcina madagascariensis)]|nr:chain length-determining protein [Candidatus Thiodiazotropha sp. (ex Dulcina madagascariensis)]MCU7926774.1 chain length-determining protein [Candidatus Thiodiazotropha sp. (ex Dulcina madagascariensis)]